MENESHLEKGSAEPVFSSVPTTVPASQPLSLSLPPYLRLSAYESLSILS